MTTRTTHLVEDNVDNVLSDPLINESVLVFP